MKTWWSVLYGSHFFCEPFLLNIFIFPIFATTWFHSLNLGLNLFILKFYKSFLLIFIVVLFSEISLKFIKARIFPISIDDSRFILIDVGNTFSHSFVFNINWISLIYWKISIILLSLYDIDGAVNIFWKVILHFTTCALKVLVVICFVLKDLIKLWSLCCHYELNGLIILFTIKIQTI